MSNVIVWQKYDQWYKFETQLNISSLSAAAVLPWPVGRDKWYLPPSFLHTGTPLCLQKQLQPCCGTHRNHNRSYFLSGFFFSPPPHFFFSQGPSLHRCFTVDITELRGDKEAEKNNNRPIDPHFTNLGGMGEIHLQVWSRLLIGPRQAFFLFFLGTRSAAEGPDWCHFLSNDAFQTNSVDVYLKSCATVSKNLRDKWISNQCTDWTV